MAEFRMPSLGADMEFGTVTRWLIKPGDEVHRGAVVAVVHTAKSTIEVEIFQSGVVDALLVSEGEEVAVGIPLARIAVPAEVAPVPQLVPAPVERPEPAPVVMLPA